MSYPHTNALKPRLIAMAAAASVVLMLTASTLPAQASGERFHYANLTESSRPAISYAVVGADDRTAFVGHSDELKKVRDYRRQHTGDYLWFRTGEQYYIIDDQKTLQELSQLWRATEPMENDLEQLSAQMEAYADDMADASDALAQVDDEDVADLEEVSDALAREADDLQQKMDQLEDRIDAQSQDIERLSDAANAKTLEVIQAALADHTAKPIRI